MSAPFLYIPILLVFVLALMFLPVLDQSVLRVAHDRDVVFSTTTLDVTVKSIVHQPSNLTIVLDNHGEALLPTDLTFIASDRVLTASHYDLFLLIDHANALIVDNGERAQYVVADSPRENLTLSIVGTQAVGPTVRLTGYASQRIVMVDNGSIDSTPLNQSSIDALNDPDAEGVNVEQGQTMVVNPGVGPDLGTYLGPAKIRMSSTCTAGTVLQVTWSNVTEYSLCTLSVSCSTSSTVQVVDCNPTYQMSSSELAGSSLRIQPEMGNLTLEFIQLNLTIQE